MFASFTYLKGAQQSVFTPPAGTPFTTDRVCWREPTLIRLEQ
jgi:hypothetical protein